jgi:hypothetical protein
MRPHSMPITPGVDDLERPVSDEGRPGANSLTLSAAWNLTGRYRP